MADTKISALTAATALAATDEFAINNSGTSKKAATSVLRTFFRNSLYNASVAAQGPGFAADTYLVGSSITIPSVGLQAKTMYRCRFDATKTAAGTATPIVTVRFGTAGTTSDASLGALTFTAGTAVTDEGLFELLATFRTVGSGTSAVLQSACSLTHRLSATGLVNVTSPIILATSAGFDSTPANSILGVSVNGGTSAAWTITQVQSELFNLA